MALSVASSGRKSFLSSVSSLKSQKSLRKVRFQLPSDIKSIIGDFTRKENVKQYEDLVCILRDSDIQDADLCLLLQKARESISLLTPTVHHLIQAIVKLKWLYRCDKAAQEYQEFLVDLLSAHNYYTKMVLEELVSGFKLEDEQWEDGAPTDKAQKAYDRVHEVLQVLLHVIPMSVNILKELIEAQFPYFRKGSQHEKYIYNMLRILDYVPNLRTDFFFLIVNRLIILDVHAPKHEISQAEDDGAEKDEQFEMDLGEDSSMKHPLADALDKSLCILFRYVYVTCHDMSVSPHALKLEDAKSIFKDLMNVFDNIILPTHGTHHVQFIMFYLCSFHPNLVERFLSTLWQKVTSPRIVSIVRQAAVSYIGSLLAQASYISLKVLMLQVSEMVSWIHNYISNQDGVECPQADIKVHPVFYSVCQAVFYVISCRYRDFINTKKGLLFLEGLNLTKIVTCSLNPLKVCLPIIVQNFAAITRNYQLAYCYTIIEHNSRMNLPVVHMNENGVVRETAENEVLDSFFPFEPYMLQRSGELIAEIYRENHPPVEMDETGDQQNGKDDEDDFLSGYCSKTPPTSSFGLSLSPSFR